MECVFQRLTDDIAAGIFVGDLTERLKGGLLKDGSSWHAGDVNGNARVVGFDGEGGHGEVRVMELLERKWERRERGRRAGKMKR